MVSLPDRYFPVSEVADFLIVLSGPPPRSRRRELLLRTDIDDVIGTHDGLFIVLYHDHCIAEIAQMKQRVEQTGIVALMQAD